MDSEVHRVAGELEVSILVTQFVCATVRRSLLVATALWPDPATKEQYAFVVMAVVTPRPFVLLQTILRRRPSGRKGSRFGNASVPQEFTAPARGAS